MPHERPAGTFCRALCRPTLSKMTRYRTARQSVRQRLATKWAEQMVLGQALAKSERCSRNRGARSTLRSTARPTLASALRVLEKASAIHTPYHCGGRAVPVHPPQYLGAVSSAPVRPRSWPTLRQKRCYGGRVALFGVSPNRWCGRFHSPFGAPGRVPPARRRDADRSGRDDRAPQLQLHRSG